MHQRVEQVLAHRDQRGGAAGREIEAAEQLLAARLGRVMQLGRGLVGAGSRPGIDRRVDAFAVDAEARRQRLEEGDARAGGQVARSGRGFRARARRRRPRRARRAVPRTARPGSRSVPQRHRAGRARDRSARGRAPRWSAASRRRRRYSSLTGSLHRAVPGDEDLRRRYRINVLAATALCRNVSHWPPDRYQV